MTVVVLVALLGLELWARSWEAKWHTFVKQWEAKGEAFDIERNLPPKMADDDEFELHPWIQRIAAKDSEVLERLQKMKPENISGYSVWRETETPSGAFPLMPLELAERMMKHGAEFSRELAAFKEALGRPGCRINHGGTKNFPMFANWVNHLTPMAHLLEAISHAAIAANDSKAFTANLQTSLQTGQKLRASNVMLPIVVGCGFEGGAYQALQSLPVPMVWPRSDQLKWIAALDLRTRSIADEYVAALRVDRGIFLGLIDNLEKNPMSHKAVPRLTPFRRVFFARAKLKPCELMQGMLLAKGGRIGEPADPTRITHFETYAKEKLTEGDPASIGLSILLGPRIGIYEAVRLQEETRVTLRSELIESQ